MLKLQQNGKAKRLKPRQLSAIAFATIALYSSAGSAAEIDQSMFSFSGFGSFGAVHSSEKNADFSYGFFQPNGAGMSRNWSTDVDSRIGGQVSAYFNNQLSAVVQIVAEQQWDNSYTPTVEWANIKYALTPDFSVRVGRIALPAFLFSDSRKVGYIVPWVRPPLEVYRLLPITRDDGMDATYRSNIGNAKNTIMVFTGKVRSLAPDGTPSGNLFKNKQFGVVDMVEYGALTLQASYLRAKLTVPKILDIPVPALSKYGDSVYYLKQASASYDPGNWFVMGEVVKVSYGLVGDQIGWHVTSGWRIDKFTPYVTYAQRKQLTDPSPLLPPSAGQKSVAAGLRWDAIKNVSFKLQYDRINHDTNSSGSLSAGPGFQPGGKVNLVSAIVDFVF